MITNKAMQEFKAIYKSHFNHELSDVEALEKATSLLNLMKLVYKPITEADLKLVEERREQLESQI